MKFPFHSCIVVSSLTSSFFFLYLFISFIPFSSLSLFCFFSLHLSQYLLFASRNLSLSIPLTPLLPPSFPMVLRLLFCNLSLFLLCYLYRSLSKSSHGSVCVKNLPRISSLALLKKKLEEVKGGVFDHSNLTELPKALTLCRMFVLSLGNNKLKSFDSQWFNDQQDLQMVKLEGNLIEKIPEGALENFLNRIQLGHKRNRQISAKMFIGRRFFQKSFLGSSGWRDLKKLLPQEQHDRWESPEGSRVPSGSQIMPKYLLLLFPMMLFILGPP
jgi:hypothetical protein